MVSNFGSDKVVNWKEGVVTKIISGVTYLDNVDNRKNRENYLL